MKGKRATPAQYETALLEEISRARMTNIPLNSLSGAVSFSIMVLRRLFPGHTSLGAELEGTYRSLAAEAQMEREQHERDLQKRLQDAKTDMERRVVLPPGSSRN